MKKNILFISGIDFKEKSIQVIRKTPEAYRDAGWDVDYIVARDNSPKENYYYEEEIQIEGINIERIYWPISKHYNFPYVFRMLLNKLYSCVVIFKLAAVARIQLKRKEYDIIYGYEMHGVLAAYLVRFSNRFRSKIVSRFQGSFLYEMIKNKRYIKLFFNLDFIIALMVPTDLIIMTDDGTEGDKAIRHFKGKKFSDYIFLPNGVDLLHFDTEKMKNIIDYHKIGDKIVCIAISRLVEWKRVDRVVKLINSLKHIQGSKELFLFIVGEGEEIQNLKLLVDKLNLNDHVTFLGGIKNEEVFNYLSLADFFISMYAVSNVGNPLLESIRLGKFIITLNNGDTSSWIEHKKNGLIYDEASINYNSMASDIKFFIDNANEYSKILEGVKDTANTRLRTWDERFKFEISKVEQLISN